MNALFTWSYRVDIPMSRFNHTVIDVPRKKLKKWKTQTAADSLDNADVRFCRKPVPGDPLLPMDFYPVSPISGPVARGSDLFCDPRLFIYLFIAPKVKASERTSAFATRSSFKIDQRRMIHKLSGEQSMGCYKNETALLRAKSFMDGFTVSHFVQ